jgi:hypothetical protein
MSSSIDAARTSVLWLIGAVGSGKSDASYHVFDRLSRGGANPARLDLDELGMSYPMPADDQDNHQVKAAVLAAAWQVYADHGAACLVLAGGVNNRKEAAIYTAALPAADWVLVQLRLGEDERRERIEHRGRLLGSPDRVTRFWLDAAADEERLLASEPFADHVLDVSGLDRAQVVDLVLTTTGWPYPHGRRTSGFEGRA